MPGTIYTIGYEGRTLEEIVCIVKGKNSLLVDVRRNAFCGRVKFKAPELAAHLHSGGWYAHRPELGNQKAAQPGQWLPPEGYGDGTQWWVAYFAKRIMSGEDIILLCKERNPAKCHRRLVAEAIRDACDEGKKPEIVHL